jgi:hypothetical protein
MTCLFFPLFVQPAFPKEFDMTFVTQFARRFPATFTAACHAAFGVGAAVTVAAAAAAAPYCDRLLDPQAMPEKYASLAPVYASADTGWIFASNQLRQSFKIKDKPKEMLEEILTTLEGQGVKVAILVAPPRPVVAGQGILRKTMGEAAADYDTAKALRSFQDMLADLRATGAIVPDLSALALGDPDLRRRFYFRRDTHWTPTGAAESAALLATQVSDAAPELVMAEGPSILGWKGRIEERGSLADLVRKSCDIKLPVEKTPTAVFATPESVAQGLLGDSPAEEQSGKRIALVGTSFSDRYKRDHYRVADALAAAFGRDVDNYSVSGGGLHRGMQGFVKSGGLAGGDYDLLVWEFPYTQNLNSTKRLGAVLKALRAASQG